MTDYVDPIYEFDAPQYVDFDALPTRDVAARARALQNETKYLRRSVA